MQNTTNQQAIHITIRLRSDFNSSVSLESIYGNTCFCNAHSYFHTSPNPSASCFSSLPFCFSHTRTCCFLSTLFFFSLFLFSLSIFSSSIPVSDLLMSSGSIDGSHKEKHTLARHIGFSAIETRKMPAFDSSPSSPATGLSDSVCILHVSPSSNLQICFLNSICHHSICRVCLQWQSPCYDDTFQRIVKNVKKTKEK